MKKTLILPALAVLCILFGANTFSVCQSLAIKAYTAGLTSPIDLKNCGDNRLFIAERAGKIRIIDADSTLRSTPFLDITSKIPSTSGEQGLLGFAFSPNYKTDGKFYVNYVGLLNSAVTSFIEEYKVNAVDSNLADLSSSLTILTQQQPAGLTNHKGGNMMFGKDGYLYISLGDGGGGGDPFNNGQNKNTFLGKILRIEVNNSSLAQPYTIPPSNPLYNDASPGVKKEIWAYGVRNPWRCSVDRLTGDIWVADVGQDALEEIDLHLNDSVLNPNFGWKIMEGMACFSPSSGCNTAGLKLPIYQYDHLAGQSITGGYVYRSAHSKALFGTYIYADFVQKWLDGLRQANGTAVLPATRLLTGPMVQGNPVSFGEDNYGDLYILFNGNNTVYKISDTSYLATPKAYFTPVLQDGAGYVLKGIAGNGLTYQWLKNGVPVTDATGPDYIPQETGIYRLTVINVPGQSDTSESFIFGALAVELKSFNAGRLSDPLRRDAQLNWITTGDNEVKGYVIQRRTAESAAFSNVGFVPGKGTNNSSVDVHYGYIDSSATTIGITFYRLEIHKKDGSKTYSDIRSVAGREVTAEFIIYPNPAKGSVSIYMNRYNGPLKVVVYDYTGKKVREQRLTQQFSHLPLLQMKGVYTLEIISNDGKKAFSQRLVVQ